MKGEQGRERNDGDGMRWMLNKERGIDLYLKKWIGE